MQVEISDRYPTEDIHRLLGCKRAECIRFEEGHAVVCDEAGLDDGLPGVAVITNVPHPLGGNLIVFGIDREDGLTSPTIQLSELAERMEVVRPLLDPQIEHPEQARGAEVDFKIRLVRHRPHVTDDRAPELKMTGS